MLSTISSVSRSVILFSNERCHLGLSVCCAAGGTRDQLHSRSSAILGCEVHAATYPALWTVEQQAAPPVMAPPAATEEEKPKEEDKREPTETKGAQETTAAAPINEPAAPVEEKPAAPAAAPVAKKQVRAAKPYATHEEVDAAKPITCNTGETVTDEEIDTALLKKASVIARLAVTPESVTFSFSKRVLLRAKAVAEKKKG